ncbi:hypothetical protein ACXZ1M_28255 [Duganella sp. PWIR1]
MPVDIPWKRLAVSGDMLDKKYGDLRFPAKWDTSIAVFYHEPAEVDPAYCHRRITYLKIVCTIANFHLGRRDVSVLEKLRKSFLNSRTWEKFEEGVTDSYPCHGALMQVGVYPNSSDPVALHDYPYISAMQPRKRELYEVATQSGEVVSQSASKLNVNKGLTSTQTQEDYDLDMGGGGGGHSGVFGLWSEQHTGEQKQVGTIQRRQTQDQNVTTSDSARDRREQYSFSTSINQLHTLLQSYHLGTNRAIFFLQPVPHMQDAKFSFLGGLRRLEGVQEFFLVVNRPDHVDGLCIEIALETAHLQSRRAYEPRLIPLTDLYNPNNLQKSEAAIGAPVSGAEFDHWRRVRDAWNLSNLDQRWPISKPGWLPANDNDVLMSYVPAYVPDIGIQDVALIFEEFQTSSGYFFVSGRKFCACWKPHRHAQADAPGEVPVPEAGAGDPAEEDCEVSSEANICDCDPNPGSIIFNDKHFATVAGAAYTSKGAQKAQYNNAVVASINHALAASLTSPHRQPYGSGSLFTTELMLDELAEVASTYREHLDAERPVTSFAAVKNQSWLTDATLKVLDRLDFHQAVTTPSRELARRLQVAETDAASLRHDLLVEALTGRGEGAFSDPRDTEAAETLSERHARYARSAEGDARSTRKQRDSAV